MLYQSLTHLVNEFMVKEVVRIEEHDFFYDDASKQLQYNS